MKQEKDNDTGFELGKYFIFTVLKFRPSYLSITNLNKLLNWENPECVIILKWADNCYY